MSWPSIYLSKSDFLKYECCASYLWLWKHKKEVVPVDEAETIKRRLEQGNEVERYARELFPEAVLVQSKGLEAKQETESVVASGAKIIFQATVFTDQGLFAMADVIKFNESTRTWTLYEVKSTNSIKKEHIIDVAFQRTAFEDAGYRIDSVGVIYLNKEYKRRSAVVARDFLLETDITAKVDEILPIIREQTHDALKAIKEPNEPKGCSCRLNSKSHHCPTFQYLNPEIPEYSVFNISRIGGKNLALLVDNEVFNVHDVPDDIKLSVIQSNQVAVAKSKQPIIDKTSISELMSELEYPLYFLDYETVSTAVPLYNDCIPYQQIPFQYSLHILREPNGELEHYEYLSKDAKTLPAKELLEGLAKHIGSKGSVVVWHKSFEMGRNREMGNLYPEYAELMASINSRIFDLKEVFSKQHFVHHQFNGSNSIKAVLPVLVPEFSYKSLDIQNGQDASIRWYDAVTSAMDADTAERTYASLIEYCCLDTLAMVKIYEYLKKL